MDNSKINVTFFFLHATLKSKAWSNSGVNLYLYPINITFSSLVINMKQ